VYFICIEISSQMMILDKDGKQAGLGWPAKAHYLSRQAWPGPFCKQAAHGQPVGLNVIKNQALTGARFLVSQRCCAGG
jgi:hypothetical protein